MKAWWKIHDKPRGNWRPLMEWGISVDPGNAEEARNLNVSFKIAYCIRGITGHSHLSLPGVCPEKRIVLYMATRPYTKNAYKVADKVAEDDYIGNIYGLCQACPVDARHWHARDTKDVSCANWAVRLPWRPGARPDYSDFIEPVRDFLRRVLEEMERRFEEARESAPSDEWKLEEEFDSFSWRTTKDGAEVAERKLRVIRK